MLSNTPKVTNGPARQSAFHKAGENLYRHASSGTYYALLKRGDKQFRRSLRTRDPAQARRRSADLREKIHRLSLKDDGMSGFWDVAQRWMETTRHTLKLRTILRRQTCLKNLLRSFRVPQGMITRDHADRWLAERDSVLAPSTFAHEQDTMRGVVRHAMGLGLMLDAPSAYIKRERIALTRITVRSRDQLAMLLETIRVSDGQPDSQRLAKPGADLCEFLAYSSCRLGEAREVRWRDVPLDPALRELLERLRAEKGPSPEDQRL